MGQFYDIFIIVYSAFIAFYLYICTTEALTVSDTTSYFWYLHLNVLPQQHFATFMQ